MKKPTLIKQLFLTGILIAGMNIYSSCDSCNRKNETTEENTSDSYETATEEDTIMTDDNGSINDGSTSSTSIGTSSRTNSKNTTTSTATVNTTKTSTSLTNSKNEEARQQAITDAIENSDAKSAVDKNGKPIRSSGDAGSGSGTGTGSTGNNSRVTTREAQKSN